MWHNGGEWTPGTELPIEFFELYETLYRTQFPNAHPESKDLIRFQFSHEHDYFQSGCSWLMLKPNQLRLCGFIQPGVTIHGKKVGYFGFWEAIDDLELCQASFQALEEWMLSHSVELLVGPVNFTTFSHYRLRLAPDASEDVFVEEPFNLPYYPNILESIGFNQIESYETHLIHSHPDLLNHFQRIVDRFKDSPLREYSYLPLTSEIWRNNLAEFYEATLKMFGGNPAFVPISFRDYSQYFGNSLAKIFCPNSSLLVRDPQGVIAGYFLCYPNYGAYLKAHGHDIRIEDLDYDEVFPKLPYKDLVGKTLGVVPEHRGKGLQYYLSALSIMRGFSAGYKSVTMALVRSGNKSERLQPPLPVSTRHYGLFGKVLKGS